MIRPTRAPTGHRRTNPNYTTPEQSGTLLIPPSLRTISGIVNAQTTLETTRKVAEAAETQRCDALPAHSIRGVDPGTTPIQPHIQKQSRMPPQTYGNPLIDPGSCGAITNNKCAYN